MIVLNKSLNIFKMKFTPLQLCQNLQSKRNYANIDPLKSIIASQIPKKIEQIAEFRKKYNDTVVSQVTVDQIYSGMRGVKAMTYETSVLDPNEGIRFRNYTVYDVRNKLPKFIYSDGTQSNEPIPEGIFWLLCTGEIPTQSQVNWLTKEWAKRSTIPSAINKLIDAFPENVHPMTQLSASIAALGYHSKYAKAYNQGNLQKSQHWKFVYEDCMDMIAKMTSVAAKIYRNIYYDGFIKPYNQNLDYSENLTQMMGYDNKTFADFMRLYLVIHCDHEGGNVSAHTNRLVASANADPYIAFASSLNGLSGPLHGRANQQVAKWIDLIIDKYGLDVSDNDLHEFIHDWLKKGVIPGYGHAVLRITDPRFSVQLDFSEKEIPNDPTIKLVKKLSKIVPDILISLGKVKNPYPNVDAISGSILETFGVSEREFYTVPFGISRAIGVSAALIWDKAIGLPIERPKSISTDELIKLVTSQN